MYHREKECRYRTRERPEGLIAPAIVHDGEANLPDEARIIQSVKLQDYALANLQPGTSDATQLEKLIRNWAPALAACIAAPPRKKEWDEPLAMEFIATFYRAGQRQRHPSWSGK
jgi:hypothetical protein